MGCGGAAHVGHCQLVTSRNQRIEPCGNEQQQRPCSAPFSYARSYQRVGFIAGDDEANATIESEVLINDGRVAAP